MKSALRLLRKAITEYVILLGPVAFGSAVVYSVVETPSVPYNLTQSTVQNHEVSVPQGQFPQSVNAPNAMVGVGRGASGQVIQVLPDQPNPNLVAANTNDNDKTSAGVASAGVSAGQAAIHGKKAPSGASGSPSPNKVSSALSNSTQPNNGRTSSSDLESLLNTLNSNSKSSTTSSMPGIPSFINGRVIASSNAANSKSGSNDTSSSSSRGDSSASSSVLNSAPVIGANQSVSTNQDTVLNFTLNSASDADGDALTYSIVAAPAHGTLTNCMGQAGSTGVSDLTCTFTPTASYFGADSFTYKVNDGSVDSSNATVSITVVHVNHNPTITVSSNNVFPLNGTNLPLIQGTQYTITATSGDSDGDTLTFSCVYETVGMSPSDVNYAASGTNCTTLPSLVTTSGVLIKSVFSFSTSTGTIVWQPTNTQKGTYKFTITASDGNGGSVNGSFYATVRENFNITNLLSGLDACYSDGGNGLAASIASIPRLDGSANDGITSSWLDITGNSNSGSLVSTFTSANPWDGVGTVASPYKLNFNGTSDRLDMGTVLSGKTKVMVSGWFNPTSANSTDKVIWSSGGGTGNGLVMRQSQTLAGKIELEVGAKNTYSSTILADSPVAYYRLGESSGTVLVDSSTNAVNGTLVNSPSLAQTGAITNDSNTSMSFNGTSSYADAGANPNVNITGTDISIEAWVYSTNWAYSNYPSFVAKDINVAYNLYKDIDNGYTSATLRIGAGGVANTCFGTTHLANNTWYHVVGTYDGAYMKVYVNGVLECTKARAGTIPASANSLKIGAATGASNFFNGTVDEVAIYNYELSKGQVLAHYKAGQGIFYPNQTLAAQPAGYWRLNELSGYTAYDWAGSNHGLYQNNTWRSAGAPSTGDTTAASRYFANSSAGYVSLPNNSVVTSVNDFTLMGWVYPYDIVGWDSIIAFGTNGDELLLGLNNGVISANATPLNGTGMPTIGGVSAVSIYTWTHVAVVRKNGNYYVYKNGVLDASGAWVSNTINIAGALRALGGDTGGTENFYGNLLDLAVFDYALSAKQISNIYSTKMTKCAAPNTVTSNTWNHFTGLWDGTNLALLVNGELTCQIVPTGVTGTASTNLTVGATASGSNYWSGATSDIKVFGTSNGSAVATITDAKSDFIATANRYRSTVIEDIVTSGLVYHFDPANTNSRKNGAYASGCASTDLNSYDLSTTGTIGQLTTTSGCAANGWRGSGIPSDPYSIYFTSGVTDSLKIPYTDNSSALDLNSQLSVEIWFKATGACGAVNSFWNRYGQYALVNDCSGMKVFVWGADTTYNRLSNPNMTDNNWHHVMVTMVNGVSQGSYIYVDGVLVQTFTFQSAAPYYHWYLGYGYMSSQTGSYGPFRIYNRPLTQAEVRQNCNAQKARFQGAVCN